jgi:hypothetical protein
MGRGSGAGYRARRLKRERERRQRQEGATGSPPPRGRSAEPGETTAARAVTVPCAWCGGRITPGHAARSRSGARRHAGTGRGSRRGPQQAAAPPSRSSSARSRSRSRSCRLGGTGRECGASSPPSSTTAASTTATSRPWRRPRLPPWQRSGAECHSSPSRPLPTCHLRVPRPQAAHSGTPARGLGSRRGEDQWSPPFGSHRGWLDAERQVPIRSRP